MFINCPYCRALVATDPATDLPPERCPRCTLSLREPLPTPVDDDVADIESPLPLSGVAPEVSEEDESATGSTFETAAPLAEHVVENHLDEIIEPFATSTAMSHPSHVEGSDRGLMPASAAAAATQVNHSILAADAELGVESISTSIKADAAIVDEPQAGLPATELPLVASPRADLPVTDLPATDLPVTDLPVTDLPVTDLAVTDQPATDPVVADAPDAEPPVKPPAKAMPSFANRRASGTQGIAWKMPVAMVALTLLLLLQLLVADREQLAADARLRPAVVATCAVLRCSVPAWREPDAMVLLDRDVRPRTDNPRVLRVTAHFRNDARWPQPWPRLRLTLSDVDGRAVAARDFSAREYLDKAPTHTEVASGQTIAVAVDVVEPAASSVAFDFELH